MSLFLLYPTSKKSGRDISKRVGGNVRWRLLHVSTAMTNNHRHFQTLSLILVFFSFACKTCTVMRPYVAEQYCWTAVSVGFSVSRHKNVMTVLSLCRYFLPSFVYWSKVCIWFESIVNKGCIKKSSMLYFKTVFSVGKDDILGMDSV